MEMSIYRNLNVNERAFLVQESRYRRKYKGNVAKLEWAIARLNDLIPGLSDEGAKIAREIVLADLQKALDEAKEEQNGESS